MLNLFTLKELEKEPEEIDNSLIFEDLVQSQLFPDVVEMMFKPFTYEESNTYDY